MQLLRNEANKTAFIAGLYLLNDPGGNFTHNKRQIVEKSSALLEVNGEDQIPVNANHSEMCKFETRDNAVYDKLSKRINRILEAKERPVIEAGAYLGPSPSRFCSSEADFICYSFKVDSTTLKNKYYNVPYNVSSKFTGRDDVCQRLQETCLPSSVALALKSQKRFVLYGLGGSGKTQICLKFAQDTREK